jgi:predicted nucleic acid-binding protein
MAQPQTTTRLPGATYAVSNTGPLISAFQSNSFELLTQIFAEIHTPSGCVAELVKHGWEDAIKSVSPKLIIVSLTADEENQALRIAEQIAQHPDTADPVAINHLGEAQAMILALRSEYQADLLLLDELAARAVAKQLNLKLSGFPGVLLLAVQGGLVSAEDLRERLELCQAQGTHYGATFIQQVYKMAQQGWRIK